MPNMIDYFPPDARPKTPLNTVIPPTTSSNQIVVPGVPTHVRNHNSSVDTTEDLIDVESSKTPPLRLDMSAKHENLQLAKTSTPLTKPAVVPKKSSSSKNSSHETKKRKSLDHEKVSKKQKVEDKKKLQVKKKQKHNVLSIPRPSKSKIYDDEKMPPLLSPNKRLVFI